MLSVLLLILVVLSIYLSTVSGSDHTCDYYVAQSTLFAAGRGIFTGRDLKAGQEIERGPSLLIRDEFLQGWPTNDYVYGTYVKNHSEAVLGLAMLYNHNVPAFQNVEHYQGPVLPADLTRSYTTHQDMVYRVKEKDVPAGSELFTSYGDEEWFTQRGIKFLTQETADEKVFGRPVDELRAKGICLSDVVVGPSKIALAGRGLFAVRDFQEGEIVYVSPAQLLPRRELEDEGGYIMNYCLAADGSDIAVFVLGHGIMANHQPKPLASLAIEWFDWTPGTDMHRFAGGSTVDGSNLRENLEHMPASKYTRFDVAFRATRDIAAGEELSLYYGQAWEHAWNVHLESLLLSRLENNNASAIIDTATDVSVEDAAVAAAIDAGTYDPHDPEAPSHKAQFRHFIQAPEGFYPSSWYGPKCVGLSCYFSCELYLAPSTYNPSTRGVFAAKEFSDEALLDEMASIAVDGAYLRRWGMARMAVAPEAVLRIGLGLMIYVDDSVEQENYNANTWLSTTTKPFVKVDPAQARSVADNTAHYVAPGKVIQPGHELRLESIVSLYPEDEAADEAKTADAVEETPAGVGALPLNYLKQHGTCLSDVYMGQSLLKGAGRGLFARRSFRAGEIVYVTPAIELPREEVVAEGGFLLNYCLDDGVGDTLLFPVGLGSLINHQPKQEANVVAEWFSWSQVPLVSQHSDGKEGRSTTNKKPKYTERDVAYRATRDIGIGEELVMFYGERWEHHWFRYLTHKLSEVFEPEQSLRQDREAIFRHPIEVSLHN